MSVTDRKQLATHSQLVFELHQIINGVYGTYLDATAGFLRVAVKANQDLESAKANWDSMRGANPILPDISTAAHHMSFARSWRSGYDQKPYHLHSASFEEIQERNQVGGKNWVYIANSCIVTIYAYWDEVYREKIADALGLPDKKQVKVPVFGDLRHLRHSIVHKAGRATEDIKNCEVLRWFEPNDEIRLTKEMFESMIDELMQAVARLQSSPNDFCHTD